MASKRRNMFHKNKTQETTEKGILRSVEECGLKQGESRIVRRVLNWKDWILSILDFLAEPHSSIPSWWYLLCTKCRQKESGPGWEPPFWQSFCPYPFCPTYRHMARVLALFLLVVLAWGIIFSVVGHDAAPGGQLFDIAVLCIAANFGGWIFRMVTMPPLVGMLFVGILFQNVGLINIHGEYNAVVAELRQFHQQQALG
ncbi:hypothetical protein AAG570_001779 [Ranatra chinensis]|uniref:Uncharacterized protein n=1 Tax=Ranatra chinensis TaxID=642074 RepID=A0ABD0YBG3_9HEMI